MINASEELIMKLGDQEALLLVITVNVMLSLIVALSVSINNYNKGLAFWTIGITLPIMTLGFYNMRGHASDFVSLVVAGTLLSVMFALLVEGIYQFQQRAARRWLIWLPVVAVFAIMWACLHQPALRITATRIVFSLQILFVLAVLMQKRREMVGRGKYIFAFGLIVALVACVYRFVHTTTGMMHAVHPKVFQPVSMST